MITGRHRHPRTLALMMPYEGLKAWRAGHVLFLEVYRVTRSFPKSEMYGLSAHMRRAAFSAAANLAEGSATRGAREFRRFIDITLGSLSELSYAIRAIKDLELATAEDVRRLEDLRREAGCLSWGLYRRVSAKADGSAFQRTHCPTFSPTGPPPSPPSAAGT